MKGNPPRMIMGISVRMGIYRAAVGIVMLFSCSKPRPEPPAGALSVGALVMDLRP